MPVGNVAVEAVQCQCFFVNQLFPEALMAAATTPLERAFYLLHQDLLGYLDAVEELTDDANADDEEILAVAREHVPNLIGALRGVICKHRADVRGLCLGCAPTWTGQGFVRELWPCPAINEVHRYMQEPESVSGNMHSP
jgi:hypothetical protein